MRRRCASSRTNLLRVSFTGNDLILTIKCVVKLNKILSSWIYFSFETLLSTKRVGGFEEETENIGWRVIFWARFIGGRFTQGGYTYIHLRWLCPCCVWCKHRGTRKRALLTVTDLLTECCTRMQRRSFGIGDTSTIQLILKLNDGQMDWQFHFQTLRRWMRLIRRAGWLTRCCPANIVAFYHV